MRRMFVFAAAALLTGVSLVGALVVPGVPETLVEGHTVFVTVESFADETGQATFAAAVAVLIREAKFGRDNARFPGVLWFNDQYLVSPSNTDGSRPEFRHPCTGSVLAVPANTIDPRAAFDPLPNTNPLFTPPDPTYVESYLITDPSDHVWIIDLWNVTDPLFSISNATVPVWTVPLLGSRATSMVPDDGTECPALRTRECATPFFFSDDRDCLDHACEEEVFILDQSECIVESATTPDFLYNAMLFVPLDILLAWDNSVITGAKDHARGSPDYLRDINGCQANTLDYPCPDNDDNAEGNSHPFNPEIFLFGDSEDGATDRFLWEAEGFLNSTAGHGGSARARSAFTLQTETVHGGSANCDGDPAVDIDCHATFFLDIFYWVAREPVTRHFREEFIDLVGSTAPYECERAGGCNDAP